MAGPLKALMLATVTALLLSCRMVSPPPPPPPPITTRCEGPDQVRRAPDGREVGRLADACTIARCEGGDLVVRTTAGAPLFRAPQAPRCQPPAPVSPPRPEVVRYGLTAR